MTEKRNALFSALSAVFISLLFCFLLGELGARLWTASHPVYDVEMWKYAKLLKKKLDDPVLRYGHLQGDADLMGVRLRINGKGLRGREYPYEKSDRSFRILVLGDSLTLGWGVNQEQTYPSLLEQELNRQSGRGKYEVINAGVGNWNTVQEVKFYWEEGYKYKPDLVILGYCINDAETEERYRNHGFLFRHSCLLVLFWSRWNNFAVRFGWRKDYLKYYRDLYQGGESAGWSKTRSALLGLAEYNMNEGIGTLVLLLPELHQPGKYYPFRNIHELLLRTGRELGVPVLDTLNFFAGISPQRLWVAPDDTHPNALAHEIIAGAVLKNPPFLKYLEQEQRRKN